MSPKAIMYTKRVSTYLTEEQLEAVRQAATAQGMDVSGYIRYVLIKAVSKDE